MTWNEKNEKMVTSTDIMFILSFMKISHVVSIILKFVVESEDKKWTDGLT